MPGKSTSSSAKGGDARKSGSRKTAVEHVSENAETIVIAVILAVLIRFFVIEAFQIPTGSMAPGLLGQHATITCPNCGYDYDVGLNPRPNVSYIDCPLCLHRPAGSANRSGDHIFVNKVLYETRDPRRWEVFVFKYPGDIEPRRKGRIPAEQLEKNYIKRCVGLPGDELRIVDGDLFNHGRALHKTDRAQTALWYKVFDLDHYRRQEVYPQEGESFLRPEGMTWILPRSPEIDLSFRPDGEVTSGRLRYMRKISDYVAYNSGHRNGVGLHRVTDLAVDWSLKPETTGGTFRVSLVADKCYRRGDEAGLSVRRLVFGLDLSDGRGYLQLGEGEAAIRKTFAVSHEMGQAQRYRLENVDYRARALIDGELVAEIDYFEALAIDLDDALTRAVATNAGALPSTPTIEVDGFSGSIPELSIYRDIYYVNDSKSIVWGSGGEKIELGPGEFFAMGDNSPMSSDSRMWGKVPRQNILGRAMFVWPWVNSYRFKLIR